MDRTKWRGDTGYRLWSSDGTVLTQDLSQATTANPDEHNGGRVYLADGDGLGARCRRTPPARHLHAARGP